MQGLHILRSPDGVTGAFIIALSLPVLTVALYSPIPFALHLAAALATVLVWENVFAALRRRPFSVHGITTALIVSLLIPTDIAIWQLVLAISLGVLLGELVFGGRGFGFLNAAVVSLSLQLFSFPQLELAAASQNVALATLPGAGLLLVLGLISWRVILGTAIGAVAMLALTGHPMDPVATGTALAFGMVFLIADPCAAAATNAGRLIYGTLAGVLIVLLSSNATISTEAVIFASLLASVFAPMIDHLVVLAHTQRRGRRHV